MKKVHIYQFYHYNVFVIISYVKLNVLKSLQADQVKEPTLDALFDLTRRDAAPVGFKLALVASFDLTRKGANDMDIPIER